MVGKNKNTEYEYNKQRFNFLTPLNKGNEYGSIKYYG